MSDDITFQNMDMWRGTGGSYKSGITFKQIVLMHVHKCVNNGSEEWCGGYWEERVVNGILERKYHQDTREKFSNSVRMLRALMLGYFDDKTKDRDEEIQLELKQIPLGSKNQELILKKVESYISMFEMLILLLKSINFFEEEVADEELI